MKKTKDNKLKLITILLSMYLIIFGYIGQSFAGYSYVVYSGSNSSTVGMYFQGLNKSASWITAYYQSGPTANPVYVPGGMTAGRITISYTVNSSYHLSAWSYATVGYIDLYLVNNDGSEVYWQKISFQPWNVAQGDTVVLGDYYLSSNYRGVRIGSLTAYCSNYMSTSGAANEGGTFKFDFYNLAWAETEDQFNSLNINVTNAYNAANSANNAAQQAKSSADAAKTSADSANTNASTAATRAQTTINQTWYGGKYGGTAESTADIAGYIRNTQLPNLQTTVNNINNTIAADTIPPTIQKVAGQNGATCTTNGTFNVVVTATDNKAGQLYAQASVDGGAWTGWYNVPQNAIPVTLSTAGAHNITVNVKDAAGNVSSTSMTAFRI